MIYTGGSGLDRTNDFQKFCGWGLDRIQFYQSRAGFGLKNFTVRSSLMQTDVHKALYPFQTTKKMRHVRTIDTKMCFVVFRKNAPTKPQIWLYFP